jgi:mono/diheme cytochrome c family protein
MIGLVCLAATAQAQLNDQTQTPNVVGAGIAKSLAQEIGAGRGDIFTPDASRFLIARDPFRSIRRGRQLFQRKFTIAQGLGPRTDDGAGDIALDASLGAGLTDNCAACHSSPFGSGGSGGHVFTRPDTRDAPHLFGLGLVEMLGDEITKDLRAVRALAIARAALSGNLVTLSLISKGIRYGTLTAHPNGTVDTTDVQGVDADLRVRPFFAQGATISIREFVVGALNAEMGLETPDPDLLAASQGQDVTTPAGMQLTGSIDTIEAPPAQGPAHDADHDGVVNETDPALVDHFEFYLLNYFKPGTGEESAATTRGRQQFKSIGCARCHIPDLWIEHDRRVADVETKYDPIASNGVFSTLAAVASTKHTVVDDGLGLPPLKAPAAERFLVQGIYADFKRHDLGPEFHESNFDGTVQRLFMTEPLWGVGSTAPYGHDGRSSTLVNVIRRHGGEAASSRALFLALDEQKQRDVLDFLGTLQLFSPEDTASNLNPINPADPDYPRRGHGSIRLAPLFNNPSEPE